VHKPIEPQAELTLLPPRCGDSEVAPGTERPDDRRRLLRLHRDFWGLGKLPPTDGTNLGWPTEFELSECSDSFALEADCLAKEK
jgi:hypothetical protein